MGPASDAELERLLGEQVAYYQALGAGYLDQDLGLLGDDEVTEALEAFRPGGRVARRRPSAGNWMTERPTGW